MSWDLPSAAYDLWACIAQLRGEVDNDGLLAAIPFEVCRSLGFSRAALLRFDEGRLTLISGHDATVEGTSAPSALAFPELDAESDLLRRRYLPGTPLSTLERWGEQLRCNGEVPIVSAPLSLGGRVVGLLRADRHGQLAGLHRRDLLALWSVAEAAGSIMETLLLRDRMRAGRDEVVDIAATTDALFDEIAPALYDLTTVARTEMGEVTAVATARLTSREAQVLGLIASGETNAGIARRLLISESTVKTHVKHILRKLEASHRAEAVSRFLAGTA